MELSLAERIKLKTQQVLVRTDDYLRDYNYLGNKAVQHGVFFAGTACTIGLLGLATIISVPAFPALAAIATVTATIPSITIGGAAVNLAGISVLGSGVAGLAFSSFAQIYKSIRGDQHHEVFGQLECFKKGENYVNAVLVDRKQVLKDIENGTFYDKYESIKVHGKDNSVLKPTANILEFAATLPFLNITSWQEPNSALLKEDCKTIRRECFKEAKSSSLKAAISNRISAFREQYEHSSMNVNHFRLK